ncbi:hypothetical protein G7058_10435 [Jeotgalibaca porci]|uniref:Uncharacterized protein n=1 Tax=Jeotgalibaca porci TaxID=1868793 RepID=A0A6G7WJH0_9LACT|nr:hypothetical protein [Jeotgalibaca porci]QIK52424.1 hypothetical protein G7058_10435 [Jeotgalibaca porci]
MFNLFDYGWLNMSSLVFGLIAWIIPIFNIIRHKKRGNNHSIPTLLSMGSCAIALWSQLSYNIYLIEINDYPALLDTVGTLNWVAAILIFTTIILNVISITLNRNVVSD